MPIFQMLLLLNLFNTYSQEKSSKGKVRDLE